MSLSFLAGKLALALDEGLPRPTLTCADQTQFLFPSPFIYLRTLSQKESAEAAEKGQASASPPFFASYGKSLRVVMQRRRKQGRESLAFPLAHSPPLPSPSPPFASLSMASALREA